MKTIRSLIKEQNKNLIRPKFALVCAYLFGILGQSFPVGSVQEVDNTWITKAMSLAVIFTAGAQIICTVRAGFARPKTWLKKSVAEITSLTDEQCASTWNRAAETVGCSDWNGSVALKNVSPSMFWPEVIQNLEKHAARNNVDALKLLSEVVRYDQKIKDKMPAYVIGFNDDNPLINKRFDSTSLAAQQKQRAIADNYEQENQPITWKIKQLLEGGKINHSCRAALEQLRVDANKKYYDLRDEQRHKESFEYRYSNRHLRTDPDQEIKRYESAMATHAEHVSRLKSDLAAIEVRLQAVATDAGLVTEKNLTPHQNGSISSACHGYQPSPLVGPPFGWHTRLAGSWQEGS